MIKIKQSKNGELEIGINEYHVFIDQDGNCCPIFIDFDNIDKLIEALRLVPVEPTKQHIHRFEEITVNGDDARKYICIYCGVKKSESFE